MIFCRKMMGAKLLMVLIQLCIIFILKIVIILQYLLCAFAIYLVLIIVGCMHAVTEHDIWTQPLFMCFNCLVSLNCKLHTYRFLFLMFT